MSSAWSQLEQMLTCAICLDKFKNPRLLPCQHSFCGDACMDGLVDYARRQIKCPECRAEHRIPYQGVQSLPLNVTLIRFLELHARITGEEPEPVPTFMEKCTICGEKIEGVQRCAHCEKKVCPECKEAHLDLLRREIGRINGQTRRSVNKLHEFKETLAKAEEKLIQNEQSVRAEIEDSCKRLISDLQLKQRRLLEEVDTYVGLEKKTIDKLKVALVDECKIIESNLELADEKLTSGKYQWNDFELTETKEIYNRTMEFVRLFDPEIGDYNRKVRFTLVPEFEALRKRLCELGELKFSESAQSLIANSFQYCNANGQLAQELCQAAAAAAALQQQQQLQHNQSGGAYGLAHSNSNTNLGLGQPFGNQLLAGANSAVSGGGASSQMLELPNALMRSQSDHRLASQFQARLKQQQEASKNGGAASRYGVATSTVGGGRPDYESESSMRSRYGPTRSSGAAPKDYSSDLLRDWPRPSDNDSEVSFGSSIQFKSAFMRRKEKERQQQQQYLPSYYNSNNDDDDDLTSEASYGGGGGGGGRNVRFHDQELQQQAKASAPKVFDCREVEHAPFSGVPKLDECPQLQTRLHQLGAKAVVDKKHAEEDSKRDKDLVESARRAMSRASERLRDRQPSEDDIEKQKKANKQQQHEAPLTGSEPREQQQAAPATTGVDSPQHAGELTPSTGSNPNLNLLNTSTRDSEQSSNQAAAGSASSGSPATPTSSSAMPGGRRSLYGQAVTEKSRRQLSNAIQDAANYSARRRSLASSRDETEVGGAGESTAAAGASNETAQQVAEQALMEEQPSAASSSQSGATRRRFARSNSSRGSQQSIDGVAPGTPTARRRRMLTRAESSLQRQQSSIDSAPSGTSQTQSGSGPKNSPVGSGGDAPEGGKSRRDTRRARSPGGLESRRTASTTTDEETDEGDADDDDQLVRNTGTIRRAKLSHGQQRSGSSGSSKSQRTGSKRFTSGRRAAGDEEEEDNDEDEEREDEDDEEATGRTAAKELGETGEGSGSRRNSGNRRSREFLPSYVNKLLDRSAQIRRDSQEQRSRGDSPQRSGTSESTRHSSPIYSRPSASGYSSSPGAAGSSAATMRHHQRLAYQRSQNDDETTTNSSQSIYTTASSQRRSSEEEAPSAPRRTSTGGSSTDRTVVGASDYRSHRADLAGSGSRYSSTSSASRRDSSGDAGGSGGGIFQSRFLSRSRTSAALGGSGAGDSEATSQDYGGSGGGTSGARSYLSSRDRFLASAGSVTGSSAAATPATSTSSSSAVPSFKTHSEYLRNKFAQRRGSSNSSGSSSSLRLGRSKSSHAFASGSQSESNRFGTNQDDSDVEEDLLGSAERRAGSDDEPSCSSPNWSPIYSPKGRMLFKLGSRGSEPGSFTWPRGVAVGQLSSGRAGHEIVVADSSNHRVQVFSSQGKFISEFGSYGSAPGEFDCLAGVAINRLQRHYIVSDRYNHRVQLFDMSGRFVRSFGEFGRDQGKFNLPWGVACDSQGSIYVCDKENHRVQVFDSQGAFVSRFGQQGNQPGQMQHPHYVALDSSGRVVVTDTNNHRVQVFDASGRLIRVVGREGSQPGEFKFPRGVAADSSGFIVVGDSGNNRLQIFNAEGQFVKAIGTWGSAEGEFKGIEGVAVDSTNGNIYVCDRENHRIQVF